MPNAVRREVLQLAKSGQPHPDAEVAAAAFAWARAVPQSRRARVFDLVVEGFSGVFAPGSANLNAMRQRLGAHRIARLGPPT